jgi:hypothetical protein
VREEQTSVKDKETERMGVLECFRPAKQLWVVRKVKFNFGR